MSDNTTVQADILVENHGSIFTFQPVTDAGRGWIDEHVSVEDWQWLGNCFSVDHRVARDLAQRMLDDGLVVR